jgi:hypothetical protein
MPYVCMLVLLVIILYLDIGLSRTVLRCDIYMISEMLFRPVFGCRYCDYVNTTFIGCDMPLVDNMRICLCRISRHVLFSPVPRMILL